MTNYWIVILCVLLTITTVQMGESPIHKLRQAILKDYDANVRPAIDPMKSIIVSVELWPRHLVELNENHGVLIMESWLVMIWKDEFLSWNPDEFSGIKSISLPVTEVWRPDLSIGFSISKYGWDNINVYLNSSGFVHWVPEASLELDCPIHDYSDYPQDVQECEIFLRSWTTNVKEVDLMIHGENLTLFNMEDYQNPHWVFVSIETRRFNNFYESEEYVGLEYLLTLKRRNVPFSSLCSLPATVARILILCMFWMPDLTKKLLLGCTSVLGLSTIAASVTSSLPSPAAAPAALSKISSSLFLCATAIVVELLISFLYSCRMDSPILLDSLATSPIGKILNPCQNYQPSSSGEYKEKLVESTDPVQKVNRWPFLAFLVERAAFIVFAVLLMAM